MNLDSEQDPSTDEAYEVWDLVSGNAITEFPSESEALAFIRSAIARHGREHVYGWGLSRPAGTALSGLALVDLALTPARP